MYEKYKDASPENSVAEAKKILKTLGISVEVHTAKRLDGIFASVLLEPDGNWTTCGKGTTEAYCLASAYGEAIEHLCNYTAYNMMNLSDEAFSYGGFEHYPDEKTILIDDLPEAAPEVFEDLRKSYYLASGFQAEDSSLCHLLKRYFRSDTLRCIPFYSIKTKKNVFLPEALINNLCGSNGGGAGNTMQEAIGHGLDEIAERYVKEQIYHRHLTPPEIPREYIQTICPELLHVIHLIEQTGRYAVSVRDCSLGYDYPVAAVILTDRDKHAYIANFGSHPQFSIALERCLTEMFQSYETNSSQTSRKRMNCWKNVDTKIIDSAKNWVSLLRDDVGVLPDSFFVGEPSWEFREWKHYEHYNNVVGMNMQFRNFLNNATDIYIRNNSYFSIGVYKVYIPGFSTTALPFNERHMHCLELNNSISEWFPKLRELSDSTLRDLMKNFFSPDMFMGGLAFSSMQEIMWNAIYAALLYYFHKTKEAIDILSWQGDSCGDCAIRVLQLREQQRNDTDIKKLVSMFYSTDDMEFAFCWLDEKPFAALAEKYVVGKYRIRAEGTVETSQKFVDKLHINLKQYMSEHPIDKETFINELQAMMNLEGDKT